jgi:hypothetical protein
MQRFLTSVSAAALAGFVAVSTAQGEEIRYTQSGTVSGEYITPDGVSHPFSNVAGSFSVIGDTTQVGSALGPGPTGTFKTVDITYGYAQIGPVSGAIDQDFFGPHQEVFALSNTIFPGPGRVFVVTDLQGAHLDPDGGYRTSNSAAFEAWDGVSGLAVTSAVDHSPSGPDVDFAFKNGILINTVGPVSNLTLSATLLTGASAGDALLPNVAAPGDGFGFKFDATAGQTVYVDPQAAIGYDYILGAGSPLITEAVLPDTPGSHYEIFALTDLVDPLPVSFVDGPGVETVDFTALAGYAGGIDGFRLLGINPADGIDPTDATGFVTGLTFAGSGPVSLTQQALATPEPGAWALMLLGFGGLGAMLRTRGRRALAG